MSHEDGIVEAIRRTDGSQSYVAAVQWHPEFHRPDSDTHRRRSLAGGLPRRRGRRQKKPQTP